MFFFSETVCATQEPSDDSCCNQAEQVENTTGFSTTNPWAILDHPCIMRQGGASREECDEIKGIGGANRGETEDSDF